ncbi:uncharacterized RNA-binding protein C644.16-like [Xenia sp. Carnegie-2017]|uniref:uncharacterized RNA-binding protein C644.16-like n=1 Tax=Xenia sp. Carnegie-2017 TaxID=2897299 RepID=UPI001F045E53|nr:uncharacterized RNA-binding protein C644.16-like [Xenia sp. Carnegie-2017]
MEYVTSEGIVVTNRIFVGSIPHWMCENKLQLAFQDFNLNVKDTRIVLDLKTGERKGYGFVTFYNVEDAVNLVKKGFVITREGIRLKVDTAIRRKGLQIRLQRQKEFLEKSLSVSATSGQSFGLSNQPETQWQSSPTMSSTQPAQLQYVYSFANSNCQPTIIPCDHGCQADIWSKAMFYQNWQHPAFGAPISLPCMH